MNGNMPPQHGGLVDYVRQYVHYDNLTKNYTTQATGARKLKNTFEEKIISHLRNNNIPNAIIQISGAILQLSEEKKQASMSMPALETYLHKYFSQKGNGVDETDAILRFIRLQRQQDCQTVACLKKIPVAAPIPPPPPANQGTLQFGQNQITGLK
jgi:hypothetical protein